MCKICRNEYDNLEILHIHHCDMITTIPNNNSMLRLHIINCKNIKEIPNITNLRVLEIVDCQNIKEIPSLHNLRILDINNCQNIKEIPNLTNIELIEINKCQNIERISNILSLECLYIMNCNNIKTIYNFPNLQELQIHKCRYFYDNIEFYSDSGYNKIEINKFYKINKIKKWWKIRSYYIKNINAIYKIIEWIEQKRMHPNSKYFQKLLESEFNKD
jgi:hypothetical protein